MKHIDNLAFIYFRATIRIDIVFMEHSWSNLWRYGSNQAPPIHTETSIDKQEISE